MNWISKVLLFIFKHLSAVVNPEFMQITNGNLYGVNSLAYKETSPVFGKAFNNTPFIWVACAGEYPCLITVKNATKTGCIVKGLLTGQGTADIIFNILAIDLTQPVLKIGGEVSV